MLVREIIANQPVKTISRLALCLLAASALVLTGCGGGTSNPSSAARTGAAGTVLTEEGAGKAFTLDPGTAFRIELASNATTGYSWQSHQHGDSVAVMKSTYVADDHAPRRVGSGGKQIFPCKALEKGGTTIRLIYRQSWKGGMAGEKIEYKIVVR